MMRTLQVLNPQDCQPREAQKFPKTLTCATGGRPVLSEALIHMNLADLWVRSQAATELTAWNDLEWTG